MSIMELGPSTNPLVKGEKIIYLDKWFSPSLHQLPGQFISHDLEETPLPFLDDTFSKVYASHVLEHIWNLCPLMDELHRIIKPDGKLMVWVPHYHHRKAWDSPDHKRWFTPRSFEWFTSENVNLYKGGNAWIIPHLQVNSFKASTFKKGKLIPHVGLRKWIYNRLFPPMEIQVIMTPIKEGEE